MARIAFLVGADFEDVELRLPYDRLREAGHEVVLVGSEADVELSGKRGKERVRTERAASDVGEAEFDALVIPGGYSPDHLRTDAAAVRLVRDMFMADKLVAAVCHGPSLLAEAGVIEGRTLTSWPSVRTDLLNAGAHVVDREVCVDGNLITSRKPADLPAFSRAIIDELAAGAAEESARREQPEARPAP